MQLNYSYNNGQHICTLQCTLGCDVFKIIPFRWAFDSSGPGDFKTIFKSFTESYISCLFWLWSLRFPVCSKIEKSKDPYWNTKLTYRINFQKSWKLSEREVEIAVKFGIYKKARFFRLQIQEYATFLKIYSIYVPIRVFRYVTRLYWFFNHRNFPTFINTKYGGFFLRFSF